MDPAFWHERWQQERIGFHLDEVNPYLLKHWSALELAPPGRVMVPLAGKSLDIAWLAGQGHEVVANEISPIAVEAFFKEQDLAPGVTSLSRGIERWRADGISMLCGDFMQLQPRDVGHIDAVYDRAALIALTSQQRPRYVQQLDRLTGSVPQLLITLEYDSDAMDGPPFSVCADEVSTLYSARYRIEEVERCDILAQSPKFRERGMRRLHEITYILRPRQHRGGL
jgi:thiopurine S-methyltransferase